MRARLRVEPGRAAHLAKRDPADRLGLVKETAEAELLRLTDQISKLQNRLWAEHRRSVLLVLQGLDASGKDGTIRRVFTGLNPQGCRVVSFKAPTSSELEHDYLWRIHANVPGAGEIGIFNRSHYEDVATTVVLGLIDDETRKRRCEHIRAFEEMLVDEGTAIVKVFLNVSKNEQRQRLEARLADPEKRWKFRRDDLETRKRFDDYISLYDQAITHTSTTWAPWYVVPADRKWVSAICVAGLLLETLEEMDPQIPPPVDDLDSLTVE